MKPNLLVFNVEYGVVVFEEIEAEGQEILITLICHDFERAGARVVADIARWGDRIDHTIDCELNIGHQSVSRLFETREGFKSKVVRYGVRDLSFELDQFHELLEFLLGH